MPEDKKPWWERWMMGGDNAPSEEQMQPGRVRQDGTVIRTRPKVTPKPKKKK